MLMKLIVLAMMAAIFLSLASAVIFLLKQKPGSTHLVKALTIRITISLILFFLLLIAFSFGWIHPHHLLF